MQIRIRRDITIEFDIDIEGDEEKATESRDKYIKMGYGVYEFNNQFIQLDKTVLYKEA